MSYEGYDEHLCKNGHRFTTDPFWCGPGYEEKPICPIAGCGKESVWHNSVDETNGPSQGKITEKGWDTLLIADDKKVYTCSHCGHAKLVGHAKYRIPTEEELKQLRVYHDC